MATSTEQYPWHSLNLETVFSDLSASPKGLSDEEARERLKEFGQNIIQGRRPEGILRILLRQFLNPIVYVLLVATLLTVVMGKLTDGIVVFSVVVINTLIGFVQEYQAGQTINSLMKMIPEFVTVMRNGDQHKIPVPELVPGDHVLLEAGDRVPADIRLSFVKNFYLDQAILTGESLPIIKQVDPVDINAGIADRANMAYSGTLVTTGTGEGIVIATGLNTEIGKISALLDATESPETPLTKSIKKVAKWITMTVLFFGIVLLLAGILRGYTLMDASFIAITLAVATIPEGLPAIITIASAIGVRRMAKRKSIIRHLPAVETLGSTTVICSDKTGTLTRNEMTVQALWNGTDFFDVKGIGIEPKGSVVRKENGLDADETQVGELLKAGALCNDASIEQDSAGNWKVVGDPTEVALIVALRKIGTNEKTLREQWPRLDELPFDPDKKIMATLHQSPEGEKILYLKGAPEAVTSILSSKKDSQSDPVPENIMKAALLFADSGMRVLAFASKKLADNHATIIDEVLQDQFEFIGLQAMIDPPRMEVKEAIQACHEAGITVKMITGDHPGTASAVARELGLITKEQSFIQGFEIQKMDDKQLQKAVELTNVFARVAPEHKLRLVIALQANGEIVAMTGDGVNDAPAVKRADIGIAMGISGTAVAKDAADMILVDDNFESIEAAVEEGRRIYDNILKSIVFIVPTSIGLGLVIFIGTLIFPFEHGLVLQPIHPIQALWVNLITAVALSLPLAFETTEPDVMQRPPRKPNSPIFNRWILLRMILVAIITAGGALGIFIWEYNLELSRGMTPAVAISEAQTMVVTVTVLFQVFYLINCRSLKYPIHKIGFLSNPSIFLGILLVLLAQLAFVYLPFMNYWFHSSPLKADAWIVSLCLAFIILPVISLKKWIQLKISKEP